MGRRISDRLRPLVVVFFLAVSLLSVVPPAGSVAGGQTHLGFFDSKRGSWALDGYRDFHFGVPKDQPLLCDWNGDGFDTVGLYRRTSGYLYLRNSNGFGFADIGIYYGIPGDKPICGDWDGDGVDTIGIYRPSNATFYLRNSNTQGAAELEFKFGSGQGKPIAGDWDGGGGDTVGLWRPWNGRLHLAKGHSSQVDASVQRWVGKSGDQVITGDWDGDGRDTVGVYRYSDGFIHLTRIGEAPSSPLDYWVGKRVGVAVAGVTGDGLEPLPTAGWRVHYVDSEELSGEYAPAGNAFDGDPATNWHTQWQGAAPGFPHQLQIDLGSSYTLNGFSYTPRQGAEDNGRIKDYELYLSDDPGNWGSPVVTSHFPNNSDVQTIGFAPRRARYVRLRALSEVGGGPWAAVAELALLSGDEPVAPSSDPPPPPPSSDPPPPPSNPPPPSTDPPPVPPGAVSVWPGESIQAAADAAGPGATLYIRAGVHRMQKVKTKDGQTFIGEPGAVLNGAKVLSGWQQDGSRWWVGGQTQQGLQHGRCASQARCNRPEELFIDNQRREHVDSLSKVGPGKWFFDYGADRIYIGDNPGGRTIETSVTDRAFYGQTNDVTVSGLTIEKYATPSQHGVVDTRLDNRDSTSGSNWLIVGNEIRLNHGVGVKAGHSARVVDNHIHHNGQLGVGAVGTNPLVEGNEISHNGSLGFEMDWERGAVKFVRTVGAVARNNNVHDNFGRGLWADLNCYDTLFEGNTVVNNTHAGILYEISYLATIRDNYLASNGYSHSAWLWGGGIVVSSSPDVEIFNNTLVNNADGIGVVQQDRTPDPAQYGPHDVFNVYVHHNNVTMGQGHTGLAQDIGDNSVFTSRNNRFVGNTYSTGTGDFFEWDNRQINFDEWRAYGQQ